MFYKKVILWMFLIVPGIIAQQNVKVNLGSLKSGGTFSFVRNANESWGIEIIGGPAPEIKQSEPARIEILKPGDVLGELSAGYKTIQKTTSSVIARAEIKYGEDASFTVTDEWSLNGSVVNLKRSVKAAGKAPGGFNSSIMFSIDPAESWKDIKCMFPGALYGDPTYDGDRSAGGTLNYDAHRFFMREDILPAPMTALSFANSSSVTMLDPSPNGESTEEETKLIKDIMTDARFKFGAFGVWQNGSGPVEFGFKYPGTTNVYGFGPGASEKPRWIRRFNPIDKDFVQNYEISFRFGKNELFRNVIRNSWRWAWNTLKPEVMKINVEQMRRILTDQLASVAATIDGRTGIPFAIATFDTNKPQWNWTMTGMGFVSKNISCANQLLIESGRDTTARGKKMRKIGLSIISSMVRALSQIPLQATGYDLATGKPWTGEHKEWLAPGFVTQPRVCGLLCGSTGGSALKVIFIPNGLTG